MPDNRSQDHKNVSPGAARRLHSRSAILARALDLQVPALPRTIRMVHALTAERTADARAIAEAIQMDYGITMKFFRVMNSAFFSPYRQDILSIRFMVVLLGFENTSKIVSSVPLMNYAEQKGPARLMAMSLLASEFASALSEISALNRESVVPCAMFTSLGHVVLATVAADAYEILWKMEKFPWSRNSFKRTTGWLPKELAINVARAWNLPMPVRECILPPDDLSRLSEDKRRLMVTVSSLEQLLFCAALMKNSDELQMRFRDKIRKVLKLSNKKFSTAMKNGVLAFGKGNPQFHELLIQEDILPRILI